MTVEPRTIGQRAEERAGLGTTRQPPPLPSLPAWGSFATTDRQRLVRTILHVAHRQIGTRPAGTRRELGR